MTAMQLLGEAVQRTLQGGCTIEQLTNEYEQGEFKYISPEDWFAFLPLIENITKLYSEEDYITEFSTSRPIPEKLAKELKRDYKAAMYVDYKAERVRTPFASITISW